MVVPSVPNFTVSNWSGSMKSWNKSTRLWSIKSALWCSRTMPSHKPPGRPKTSLKNWTALRFCHIQPTVLTELHQITAFSAQSNTFWRAADLTSLMKSRKRVKDSLIRSRLNGTWRDPKACELMAESLRKWWSLFWGIICIVFVITWRIKFQFFLSVYELSGQPNISKSKFFLNYNLIGHE